MRSNSVRRRYRLAPAPIASLCALLLLALIAGPASAADPTVSGPITGGDHGRPATSITPTLKPLFDKEGYTEKEYFLKGTARSFASANPLTSDGKWSVSAADTAPYKTRILVRLPRGKDFNGTIYVEWLNVSQGFDVDPTFLTGAEELLKQGYGWVGVSAQKVGVDGSPVTAGLTLGESGLKDWDPARYGSLENPGDSFSYDIYTQAARALRNPNGVDPLRQIRSNPGHHHWSHGHDWRHSRSKHRSARSNGGSRSFDLIATGDSQSAGRLVTYVDAVAPQAHAYDGYLIQSHGAAGAPLSQAPQPTVPAPSPTLIRTDIDVPVMNFNTETDVVRGFWKARQPASSNVRAWELAGSSHFPLGLVTHLFPMLNRDYPTYPGDFGCNGTPAGGPEVYVFRTAVRRVADWVDGGAAPRQSPFLAINEAGVALRDERGNIFGGIRTPFVDVPVSTLTGVGGPAGNAACELLGNTFPFTQATLDELYSSHKDYVRQVSASADLARTKGWLLADEADAISTAAAQSDIP